MTHRIYVVGLTHAEADRYIREQNGNVPKHVEFVNLSNPEQLRGLRGVPVVTVGGFAMREDCYEFKRLFSDRGVQLHEKHWGAREGF